MAGKVIYLDEKEWFFRDIKKWQIKKVLPIDTLWLSTISGPFWVVISI